MTAHPDDKWLESIVDKHIPKHNTIADDESHYHCEECADIIWARALEVAREVARQWESVVRTTHERLLWATADAAFLEGYLRKTPEVHDKAERLARVLRDLCLESAK